MAGGARDDSGKRLRSRVGFVTGISVAHQGQVTVYNRTHDVSMNGVFVTTAKPLPLGAEGDFSLILSVGMRREKISGRYTVVRVATLDDGLSDPEQGAGMALKFVDLEPESSELLFQVISYNQPD